MEMIAPFLSWVSPIASAVIIAALTAQIAAHSKRRERRDEEESAERRKWRAGVDERLDRQEETIKSMLNLTCSNSRSDIIHKCHRYIDDLGCASHEEKTALKAQYEDYEFACKENGIENDFVKALVDRAMELPEREI